MADVKPFDVVLDYCIDRCYCQSDCGRFYSHIILADVIAINMWDDVTTHN